MNGTVDILKHKQRILFRIFRSFYCQNFFNEEKQFFSSLGREKLKVCLRSNMWEKRAFRLSFNLIGRLYSKIIFF